MKLLVAGDSDLGWLWSAEGGGQEAREDVCLLLLGGLLVGMLERQGMCVGKDGHRCLMLDMDERRGGLAVVLLDVDGRLFVDVLGVGRVEAGRRG